MVEGWSERTSEKFRFAFKAPQLITHIMKLGKGSTDAADRFDKVLEGLGPRRGPILFQLPPYLKMDPGLLAEFLSKTSDIRDRVFEFRHESWFDDSTFQLLERNGAGFCIAETEDLEPVFRVTGGIAYFRLRKESYDEGTIDKWAEKILKTAKEPRETYVYLKHDESGENAILAQRLFDRLNGAKPARSASITSRKR